MTLANDSYLIDPQNADIHLMGVHKLTTADLETLGRWKSKSKDPNHCPEYMVRTSRMKKKKKANGAGGKKETEATFDAEDIVSVENQGPP